MAHPKQFFMVYGMNQGAPTVRHDTMQQAKREAERLARACPGIEFYVLAAISRSRRVDVETDIIAEGWPDPQDDGVPF